AHNHCAAVLVALVPLGGVRANCFGWLLRPASNALIASFRRDSARRSYRPNAGSRRAISVIIVVNLSGSASFEERNFTSSSGSSSHRQQLRIIRSAVFSFLSQFVRE